jgi:hypothetical protein
MEIPLGAIGWVAWSIMPKSPPDATTDAAADVGADSTPQPTRRRT